MVIQKHGSFIKRENLPIAMTASELDIPVDDEGHTAVQPYALAASARFSILNARLNKIGHFEVVSYNDHDGVGGLFTVQNVISHSLMHLSNWQISQLERQGRFIPQEGERKGKLVESSTALDDDRRAAANIRLGYVLAAFEANGDQHSMPSNLVIKRSAAKHAKETGQVRSPDLRTLKGYIQSYLDSPFNRLLALAPGITRGNTTKAFSSKLEELLALAIEHSWRMRKGTWKTAKNRFHRLLALKENADVRKEASDEHGNLIYPCDRTIQRRRADVDHFTRDFLRFGQDAAMRKHGIKVPQLLPTAPLDVVEMDYTTLDIPVFDDRFNFIYGKPSIGVMKDRMTGVALGYAIFFETLSFETFLQLLETSIYPKDMSAYPGLTHPFHGTPLVIVVDNESHLVSDDMRALCDHLGIQLRETRPGEPNMKGAIERFFRTLADAVIHNLPGATMSNPQRRKAFDKDHNLGVPHLTLRELEGCIQHFLYEYHRTPHQGLGFLRTLRDTPLSRWESTIGQSAPRRPIDPELFATVAGNTRYAAIHNGSFVWDHITYHDERLMVLSTAPTTRFRKAGVETTKFKCFRNPTDLGHAYVSVPELDMTIKAHAIGADAKYASGLRLYQHRKAMEQWRKKTKAPIKNVADLEAMLASFADDLKHVYAQRKKQRTAEAFAKFYAGGSKKLARSQIVEVAYSPAASSDRIDYASPVKAAPVRTRSQANPRHNMADTPEAIHVRDEDGRLVPSDPLLEAMAHHKREEKSEDEARADDGHPAEVEGYEDPDDIQFLLDKHQGDEE